MSFKSKKIINPFQHYFGIGDLLFYVSITPLFSQQNYILFFVLSMLFAIGLQLSLKKISTEETVPLAGFSALLLCIVFLKDHYFLFHKMTLL
ncbi:hypothetical protein OA88_13245 [Flavobacterium sp. JRM]|nr:hypothetical protein OA88_13245 [Flavobacterium sp. JRM]